jgi:hypothetical protein
MVYMKPVDVASLAIAPAFQIRVPYGTRGTETHWIYTPEISLETGMGN